MKIKAGYVLVIDYNGEEVECMVTFNSDDRLAIVGPQFWSPLDYLNDDLQSDGGAVVVNEIYGRTCNSDAWKISTYGRKLLWKREEPVEMTIEEIEKALGKKIKIVE